MRLDDGTVHARRKTEVIRVDDQPPQAASLAGSQNAACTANPQAEPGKLGDLPNRARRRSFAGIAGSLLHFAYRTEPVEVSIRETVDRSEVEDERGLTVFSAVAYTR